jgi:hypothetical protein
MRSSPYAIPFPATMLRGPSVGQRINLAARTMLVAVHDVSKQSLSP